MHVCTKVTLRQRLLKSGKVALYLDYYPAIRNPRTNRCPTPRVFGHLPVWDARIPIEQN